MAKDQSNQMPASGESTDRNYVIDHDYRDTRDASSNQFWSWMDIKNSGGIRPSIRSDGDIAFLVLVSAHIKTSDHNPWEDTIDREQGRVLYWGDAKSKESKKRDDWQGNRYLERIWVTVNQRDWSRVPPILHFSKPKKGLVRFSGLCVLEKLEDKWMEDKGRRIRNYRAALSILPVDRISLEWITGLDQGKLNGAPEAWKVYRRSGEYRPLLPYMKKVRDKLDQLPDQDSQEFRILEELSTIDPFKFESLVVRALQATEVRHQIEGTSRTRDGGFDFVGSFLLPPPLGYSIRLKGEVKRYKPDGGGVGPKDVARLVARLQRGEHGIFVTTSYFTLQAQSEVLEDGYPVDLISGSRLISLLTEVGAIQKGRLVSHWLTG